MNFRDTIYALQDETKRTTIFALLSYGDAKTVMGFRRAWYGTDLRDPIIDGNVFMLCADAWDKNKFDSIEQTDDLAATPLDDIEIRLRADTFDATIYLGSYRVLSMTVESEEEVNGLGVRDGRWICTSHTMPSVIRLEIERVR